MDQLSFELKVFFQNKNILDAVSNHSNIKVRLCWFYKNVLPRKHQNVFCWGGTLPRPWMEI